MKCSVKRETQQELESVCGWFVAGEERTDLSTSIANIFTACKSKVVLYCLIINDSKFVPHGHKKRD